MPATKNLKEFDPHFSKYKCPMFPDNVDVPNVS